MLTDVLARLTAAGSHWIAIARAVPSVPDALVLDPANLRVAPLMVDPFDPGPCGAAHHHLERLAALIEAAFRPPGPVRAALRLALRRVYAEHGWDLVTGQSMPGLAGPPGVPGLDGLTRAAVAVGAELGCQTAVRAFCASRLRPLWQGPAGRFLHGGHPADLPGLLRQNLVFTVGQAADPDAAFLAGVLLARVADELRACGGQTAIVLALPMTRSRVVLDELRSCGAEVIPASAAPATTSPQAVPPPAGRRSPACGLQCRQRPCSGQEMHQAGLRAGSDAMVWLRLWTRALILAFLSGNALPQAPSAPRRAWSGLDARTRECLLATLIDDAVSARARALRPSYDPRRLTAAAASAAAGLLARQPPHAAMPPHAPQPAVASPLAAAAAPRLPSRGGHVWVIPQLRWLHEAERLIPLGREAVCHDAIAPPLDFELSGLVDWPGIKVKDRLRGLRCHRLSMALEGNRMLAAIAVHGEADSGLAEDLAIAGVGRAPSQRLHYVARLLGTTPEDDAPGWLEAMLSWPERPARVIEGTYPRVYQAATG